MTEKISKKQWSAEAFLVQLEGSEPFMITVSGRERWALESLIAAGDKGCTPIDTPGPRWSAYIHDLRHDHSVPIATETEPHEGPFPGTHARYRLLATVTRVDGEREAA